MKQFFLKKHIFAVCFLTFLLVFSVWNVCYNWEELEELAENLGKVSTVAELETWIDGVNGELNEEILGRMEFVETYGFVQRLQGKREFNGFSYVKDNDDGMMYYGALLQSETTDLEEYAGNVQRLNEYVESRGAKLLFVLPPAKILAGVSTVNQEWPINDPNARMDKMLDLLRKRGVYAIDMRPVMQESGRSLEEIFFKTDHHWTPLAAFYANAALVNRIRLDFGDDWDPQGIYCDLDNYNSHTYTECMLGSTGRNAGVLYSGLEDYTVYWPKFETNFTWTNYEKGVSTTGSFSEALMNKSGLEIQDIYNESINKVYLDEIVEHERIVNHLNPNGPKIAVLRDSYFSPMACFMAPMCSEIEMVWGRSSHTEIDFEDFIRNAEFDYLILEIYPYNLDQKSFAFFQKEEK